MPRNNTDRMDYDEEGEFNSSFKLQMSSGEEGNKLFLEKGIFDN